MLQESVVDCSHFDRDFLMFKTFILAIGLTLTGSVAAITANWNGTLEMVVDGDDLCWQTSESGKLPSFAATPHLAPKATVVLGNGSVDWFCKDAYATMMNIRLKDTYYSFTLSGTTNATTGTVGLYTTGDYTQKGTLHGSEVTVGFGTPIELIFDYDKAEGTLSAYINGMLLSKMS